MSVSKKTRFEIFKRDGYTCQYCGRKPSDDVVLEVDHIHPRSEGGTDEEINLTTACFDCNRGKSNRKLGDFKPRPDADLKSLEMQQEMAEVRRYLQAKEEKESLYRELREKLLDVWREYIGGQYIPHRRQFDTWLAVFSPEEIERAFAKTSAKVYAFNNRDEQSRAEQAVKYASGVMYRTKEERDECQND